MHGWIVARVTLIAANLTPVDDEEVGVARSRDPASLDLDFLVDEQTGVRGVAVEQDGAVDHPALVAFLCRKERDVLGDMQRALFDLPLTGSEEHTSELQSRQYL